MIFFFLKKATKTQVWVGEHIDNLYKKYKYTPIYFDN